MVEEYRNYQKQYFELHPEMKLKSKWQSKMYKRRIRLELMKILGGVKCNRCGYDDYRALQLDHIHGFKGDRRKHSHDVETAFYIKNPELAKKNMQVLCANCNWVKKWERQEHPKRSEK